MSNRTRLFMQYLIAAIFIILNQTSSAQPILEELIKPTPSYADEKVAQLNKMLPLYQEAAINPWPMIPSTKKILKLGSKNSAVPLLCQRLKATRDLPEYVNSNQTVYDGEIAEAVKNFQSRHGLKADGVVGKNTLRELNITPAQRIHQIEINIQRWASLSKKLKNRFALVNIPSFELALFEDNQKVLSMKAIVGKTTRPTPEIISKITRIVFNPYWNVPEVIAQKDIVPKVIDNPAYLDDMHIRIFDRQDDDPMPIDPNSVDWRAAEEHGFPYHMRQDPGIDNALGVVKFEFVNDKDVYLHDTPAKNLFDEDQRLFSSGCIRLERALDFANYLMKNDPRWNEDEMQAIIDSGKTTYVKAPKPIPIIITYITAWVDDDGVMNFRDDVYGKDI